MTLKYIGKKIWDIAIRLSEFSCSCGWGDEWCEVWDSHTNTHTIESSTKNEGHESKKVMM